ncbi:MAG: DMT family transporter [Candidatus Helarchaeota archaeon]
MSEKQGINYLIISAVIWGTSFPVIEWILLLTNIHFYFLFTLRISIALIGSITIILIFKRTREFLAYILNYKIVLIGLINMVAFGFQFLGQSLNTNAGKTALLIDINIIYVSIMSKFIFRELIGKLKLLGIIIGIIGAYFLTIGTDITQLLTGNIFGDFFVFLAGLIWAVYIILSKDFFEKEDENTNYILDFTNAINFYTFLFSLIPMFIFFSLNTTIIYFTSTWAIWILIIHLGLNCSFIAFLLFHKGLDKVSSIIASVVLLLEVLTANILGIIFLPDIEYFTIDFLIGAICISVAVIICNLNLNKKSK